FLASGTECGHHPVVAKTCRKRVIGKFELSRINPQTRKRPTRTQTAQCTLECLLSSERLDGHIDTAASQPLRFRDHINFSIVEDYIRSHAFGHCQPGIIAVNADDERSAHELCTGGCAETYRSLCEDNH